MSIHSHEENIFVFEKLLGDGEGWIGGLKVFNTWVWGDQTAWEYELWGDGEPGEEGDGNECLKMGGKGKWYRQDCNADLQNVLCKLDPQAPTPTNPTNPTPTPTPTNPGNCRHTRKLVSSHTSVYASKTKSQILMSKLQKHIWTFIQTDCNNVTLNLIQTQCPPLG